MSYTLADKLQGKPMFVPYGTSGHSMMCLMHESTFDRAGEGCYYCLQNKPVVPDPIEEFDRTFHAHADVTRKRHRSNGFSDAANPLDSAKSKDMAAIYAEFVARGSCGAIAEDVYLALGYPPQTGSARCSDLKRSGKLVPALDAHGKKRSGTTRTGSSAAILVADIFAPNKK